MGLRGAAAGHPPRRARRARQGALLLPARRDISVGLPEPAAGAVGPVTPRPTRRHARTASIPLLHWREIDIWRYVRREKFPSSIALLRQGREALSQHRLRALLRAGDSNADDRGRDHQRARVATRPPSAPAAPRTRRTPTPCRSCAHWATCRKRTCRNARPSAGHRRPPRPRQVHADRPAPHDTDSLPPDKTGGDRGRSPWSAGASWSSRT